MPKVLVTILEIVATLAAVAGGMLVLESFSPYASAPQQGALAAAGVGLAAIPYFVASMAHRAYVRGTLSRSRAEGPPAELKGDGQPAEGYLG